MRHLALLLLFTMASAFAVELPYCRVTVDLAKNVGTDPQELKTIDGWYDASTHCLFTGNEDKDPFAGSPLDPTSIVEVVKATRSPRPMPEATRKASDAARVKYAKPDETPVDEKAEAKPKAKAKK